MITDVHIEPNYRPDITTKTYCAMNETNVVYTDQFAPYGRLGCDPPIVTLELILKRIS